LAVAAYRFHNFARCGLKEAHGFRSEYGLAYAWLGAGTGRLLFHVVDLPLPAVSQQTKYDSRMGTSGLAA